MKIRTLYRMSINTGLTPLHKHINEYEFHYIVRGQGVFQNGVKSHTFSNNTIFFTAPGTMHSLRFEPRCDDVFYYCSLFKPKAADKRLVSMIERKFKNGYLHIGAHNVIYFDDIRRKIFSGNTLIHRSGTHEFYSLLYEFAEGKPEVSDQKNLYIEAAIRIIQDKNTTKLDLDAISQKLGLNKSYFIRLFKKRMGVPPMQYFLRLKIESACHLLKHTRLPIYMIAKHLHFVDAFYFSRMFKKIMKVSPKIYRA